MIEDGKNKWRVNTGCNLGYDQSENKVHIYQILLVVTMDCMLKCRYCAHFCDVNRGTVDPLEIERGIDAWSQKLSPHIVQAVRDVRKQLIETGNDYLLDVYRKRADTAMIFHLKEMVEYINEKGNSIWKDAI